MKNWLDWKLQYDIHIEEIYIGIVMWSCAIMDYIIWLWKYIGTTIVAWDTLFLFMGLLKSCWNQLELKHMVKSGHMLRACIVKACALYGWIMELELEEESIHKGT